jgi:hypothetical protein
VADFAAVRTPIYGGNVKKQSVNTNQKISPPVLLRMQHQPGYNSRHEISNQSSTIKKQVKP